MAARISLYIQDSKSKRFLQRATTVAELKTSKSTILRWSNEMGHPPPEKGAMLLIEDTGLISEAVFGATRIRWKDVPRSGDYATSAKCNLKKSVFAV